VSNLANEDVNLVGAFDQTWSVLCGSSMHTTFKICMWKHRFLWWNIEAGKFLSKVSFTVFCPLFAAKFRLRFIVCHNDPATAQSPNRTLWKDKRHAKGTCGKDSTIRKNHQPDKNPCRRGRRVAPQQHHSMAPRQRHHLAWRRHLPLWQHKTLSTPMAHWKWCQAWCEGHSTRQRSKEQSHSHQGEWQWHDFIHDSVHESQSCPKFWTKNWCVPQGWRHKIESGTQVGTETLSSHTVFCHDSARSCGHVVTSVFIMTKHAHRVSNLANEDVNLVGAFDQTWSVLCGSSMHTTFKICMWKHLFLWWNCWTRRNTMEPMSVRVSPCVQRVPGPIQAVTLSEIHFKWITS